MDATIAMAIAAVHAGAMARVAVARAAGVKVVADRVGRAAVRAAVPVAPVARAPASVLRAVPVAVAGPAVARVVPVVVWAVAREGPVVAVGPVAAAGVRAVAATPTNVRRSATAVRARRCPRVARAGW